MVLPRKSYNMEIYLDFKPFVVTTEHTWSIQPVLEANTEWGSDEVTNKRRKTTVKFVKNTRHRLRSTDFFDRIGFDPDSRLM